MLRAKADAWDFADGAQQHSEMDPVSLNARLIKELVVPHPFAQDHLHAQQSSR